MSKNTEWELVNLFVMTVDYEMADNDAGTNCWVDCIATLNIKNGFDTSEVNTRICVEFYHDFEEGGYGSADEYSLKFLDQDNDCNGLEALFNESDLLCWLKDKIILSANFPLTFKEVLLSKVIIEDIKGYIEYCANNPIN